MKTRWEDEVWHDKMRKALLLGLAMRPNWCEQKVAKLLERYYPSEWVYVGDGKVIIGGKCPDFINVNGKKQIIEVFGEYWHTKEEGQERVNLFRQYGYDTLIIWTQEIRKIKELSIRIKHFVEGGR